jgi:hypothetical protein
MSSIKCKNCGLANFAADIHCRRCSASMFDSRGTLKKEKRPRRFSVISLAVYAALAFGGYYLYGEMMHSIENVNQNDAYRVGAQPPQKIQQAGLSRTEQDRQRASQFSNNLKDNPSLQAKRKHEEETQKAMQQASNSQ